MTGQIVFDGFVFENSVTCELSAEIVKFLFLNCAFTNEKNVERQLPAVVNDGRTDVEFSNCRFSSRGIEMNRGRNLIVKDSVFTVETEREWSTNEFVSCRGNSK
jgi:hypothetical protein